MKKEMLKRRITVVTGKNAKLIEDYAFNILTGLEDSTGSHSMTLSYPESKKHPEECAREVFRYVEGVDSLMILTFSSDVLNLLGALIEKEFLSNEDIEVKVVLDENRICSSKYTDEGYLTGEYPLGYLSYMSDIEDLFV